MARGDRSSERDGALRLDTTGRAQPIAGAVCLVLGVCLGVYVHRAGGAAADPRALGVGAAGMAGFGAWLAGRRTSVVLDRAAMTATARWRWLFLHGEETVSAAGKSLFVERAARVSKDSDVEVHEIVLDGLRLRRVTEMEGGADEAIAAAKRMASHLGISYGGRRDSAARRRGDERRRRAAKYAMAPLLVVVVVIMLAFVYMTLFGPIG